MRDDATQRDIRRRDRGLALGIPGAGTGGHSGEGRRPGARLAAVLLAACAFALVSSGDAYAYWTLTATCWGAATAATVGQGAKPTASAGNSATYTSASVAKVSVP